MRLQTVTITDDEGPLQRAVTPESPVGNIYVHMQVHVFWFIYHLH